MKKVLIGLLLLSAQYTMAQQQPSEVWVADKGDGTYQNPIIHADYSDPDAIRVGDDYYMIASSMNHMPGLPILHSKDLVNWSLMGHALQQQAPLDHFSKVQHGGGVWAPSLRYHNNQFYIYYPDPDFGIYVTKATNINGPWSQPQLVQAGKGLIDPCPLWDDNGKTYLVHAFAGSRAGIKSILVVKEMNTDGTQVIGKGTMVYDGHDIDPTIEGPKLYKRNGWYYIFAPAGGVPTGWQLVLRSKNIYGPYERKVMLHQGNTAINGPHQGAWVTTQAGEDWFLHFQDKEAYGRVVHLQPMQWKNDWPLMGEDKDGDGIGEPVLRYRKPKMGKIYPISTIADSDEFNTPQLGLQWQWQANPQEGWAYPTPLGYLRMFSIYQSDSVQSIWNLPNILGQKLPAETFTAQVKLTFHPKFNNEKIGLAMLGTDYAYIALVKRNEQLYINFTQNKQADKGNKETELATALVNSPTVILQIKVAKGGLCYFSFSEDNGSHYTPIGPVFTAMPGKWVGAKLGLFCQRNTITNDAGYANIDWFHIIKNKE
jgi:beta-xylosidase